MFLPFKINTLSAAPGLAEPTKVVPDGSVV